LNDLLKYSSWEPKEIRTVHLIGFSIALIISLPLAFSIAFVWAAYGYEIRDVAWYLVMVPPIILVHELIHGAFQWLFGKKRPRLGFSFPFPYSEAPTGVSVSRDQGVVTALAPFLVVCCCLLPLPFVASPVLQVGILALFGLHTPCCTGDFRFAYVLMKYSRKTRVRTDGKANIIFED
jgi:hypothetical protein